MNYDKVLHVIASRIYQDHLNFLEMILQMRVSVQDQQAVTQRQGTQFLRANRNASFLRQRHHFETVGVLGAGGFGSVELVRSRSDPSQKLYALKTMYVRSPSRRASYQRIARIERDFAILGANCAYLMTYKAVWVESNYPDHPDSFKFLMPVMEHGCLNSIITQLHPYVVDRVDYTFFDMLLIRQNYAESDPFKKIKMEREAIRRCGLDEKFTRIYAQYLLQMVAGVAYLHSHSIVHHDIKPDNFLVDGHLRLKLADYGLSSAREYSQLFEFTHWATPATGTHEFMYGAESQTHKAFSPRRMRAYALSYRTEKLGVTRVGGTTWYLAPETFPAWYHEKPDRANRQFPRYRHYPLDWYAVGMTLFELLVGKDIFDLCLKAEPSCAPTHDPEGVALSRTSRTIYLKMDELSVPFLNAAHPLAQQLPHLLVDMRFMHIVRGMMRDDPQTRMEPVSIYSDPVFISLTNGVNAEGPAEWIYNEFHKGEPQSTRVAVMASYNANLEAGFNPIEPPAQHTEIPQVSSFAFMTGSPELIATPVHSPTKRMRLARGE